MGKKNTGRKSSSKTFLFQLFVPTLPHKTPNHKELQILFHDASGACGYNEGGLGTIQGEQARKRKAVQSSLFWVINSLYKTRKNMLAKVNGYVSVLSFATFYMKTAITHDLFANLRVTVRVGSRDKHVQEF